MIYVALLRGVNVGGNRKVEMQRLRDTFEGAGMNDVRTYINSGNVVFSHPVVDERSLAATLEAAIEATFGFAVTVLVRSEDAMSGLAEALPDDWVDDKSAKCDVMFLGAGIDTPAILEDLTVKPDIDDVRYVPGALLWRVERQSVTRSGMMRLVGTDTYRQMTVRNCNTARRLTEMARAAQGNR